MGGPGRGKESGEEKEAAETAFPGLFPFEAQRLEALTHATYLACERAIEAREENSADDVQVTLFGEAERLLDRLAIFEAAHKEIVRAEAEFAWSEEEAEELFDTSDLAAEEGIETEAAVLFRTEGGHTEGEEA